MANMIAACTASTLALLTALNVAAQQPVAPPVSVPGTPGISVSGEQLATLLQAAAAKAADPAVAEVGVTDQYAIHEVRRLKAGPAAVHPGWSEIHLILEGGATLVTGGKMTTAADGTKTIEGGISHVLKKGDVFIIPADTPHMYSKVSGSVSYFEVRFVTAPPANPPPRNPT
jgi:mannose-6-phosphate isomerase-like protein (cupin superfamily)